MNTAQNNDDSAAMYGLPGFPNTTTQTPSTTPAASAVQPASVINEANQDTRDVIPAMSSPITADALIEKLKVSMTVGAGDIIEGALRLSEGNSIVIRGTIRGEVVCKGVVLLMSGGKVEGNIVAGQAWIEGDVLPDQKGQSRIDAGILHIGNNARVEADCVYDRISIATQNRGVKGKLDSRSTTNDRG